MVRIFGRCPQIHGMLDWGHAGRLSEQRLEVYGGGMCSLSYMWEGQGDGGLAGFLRGGAGCRRALLVLVESCWVRHAASSSRMTDNSAAVFKGGMACHGLSEWSYGFGVMVCGKLLLVCLRWIQVAVSEDLEKSATTLMLSKIRLLCLWRLVLQPSSYDHYAPLWDGGFSCFLPVFVWEL
ncbi:hypothetical protein U1Q18_027884 [Sarracenia purpurea var. burkii]